MGQCLVDAQRQAVRFCERLDGLAVLVEDLGPKLAVVGIHVDEQILAGEADRARGQHARFGAGVHRGEPVASDGGQAGCVGAWCPVFRPAADVEVELVADDQASAAGRLDVAPVPGPVGFIHPGEGTAVGPVPVEAVAAEAQEDLVPLGSHTAVSLPDGEQPDHEALVRHAIEVVELRRDLGEILVGVVGVQPIGVGPKVNVLAGPLQALGGIGMLTVGPGTPHTGETAANTIHPDLAEGVVEDGGAVADARGNRHRLTPVDPIRRAEQPQAPMPAALVMHGRKQLVSPRGILLEEVEPDGVRIARLFLDDVRARQHVQRRLFPVNAVLAGGVTGGHAVAAEVPHLEELVGRVVPDAVAEDHGGGLCAFSVGRRVCLQHRTGRMILRPVEGSLQRGLFHQKVVDQQLPPHVDGDHFRRVLEIGHRHHLAIQLFQLRRPLLGQADAVV